MKTYRLDLDRNYGYSRIGRCQDCDEVFEDMKTALPDARKHTMKTGHATNVEVAVSYKYSRISLV